MIESEVNIEQNGADSHEESNHFVYERLTDFILVDIAPVISVSG